MTWLAPRPRAFVFLGILFAIYLFLASPSFSISDLSFLTDSGASSESPSHDNAPSALPPYHLPDWPWKWKWDWPWRGAQFSFEFCAHDSLHPRPTIGLPDDTGSVRGIRCTYSAIEAFLGIPYAQPPVASLRFNAPVELSKDPSREYDGSRFGKMCLQYAVRFLQYQHLSRLVLG